MAIMMLGLSLNKKLGGKGQELGGYAIFPVSDFQHGFQYGFQGAFLCARQYTGRCWHGFGPDRQCRLWPV